MGVFVSSRQVRMGINLMTPWWLSGASIDLDFDNGRYYDSSLGGSASLAPLNSYLSISRASIKYAKTAAGTLTSFGNDTLAITDLGLLIEDARMNVFLRSQELDSASWNQLAFATATANATASPDGTTTADKLVETAVNNIHRSGQDPLTTAAGFRTFSVYAKVAERSKFELLVYNGVGQFSYRFDLSAVTATQTSTNAIYTSQSTAIEQLGSGWFRCSMTATWTGTAGGCYIYLNDNSGTQSYLGDGTSGIYFWGAQMEEGAFPSSYIPTAGASATRAADNISITGTANTLINAATGSIVARIGNTGGGSFAANIIDSNGTNCLGFNSSNNGLASITATLATSNAGNRSSTDDSLGLGWAASARSLVLNGGTVATDTTSQTPSATQKLGSASGSSNFIYSYIERLTVWNSKLANATLQSLTTL